MNLLEKLRNSTMLPFIIKSILHRLDLLEIGGNSIESVTGDSVDNTDPLNPVITTVDSRPYKVYTANLVQSGTDAPVPTIFENTIGNIVWTRNDVGDYSATLNGAFTVGKTIISYLNNTPSLHGDKAIYSLNEVHFGVFTIDFTTEGFLNTDGFDPLGIEIKVYN